MPPMHTLRKKANGSVQICRKLLTPRTFLLLFNFLRSLIYQLLDYERALQSGNSSPSSFAMSNNVPSDELEWERQRQALEEEPEVTPFGTSVFVHEAKALDQEMADRNMARKSSLQSETTGSSGLPVAPGWKSRYGFPSLARSRTGSICSNLTGQSSAFGEDILEEGEEDIRFSSGASPSTLATDEESHGWSNKISDADRTIVLGEPTPKVPVSISTVSSHKIAFNPLSRPRIKLKMNHRPPPLVNLLPPVPSSPLPASIPIHDTTFRPSPKNGSSSHSVSSSLRSRKLEHRRSSRSSFSSHSSVRSLTSTWSSSLQTPSQTLLVFPSEEASGSSSIMLTATPVATSFPHLPPGLPNLVPFRKSCNIGVVSTPTTAFSFVEVRGTNISAPSFKRQA